MENNKDKSPQKDDPELLKRVYQRIKDSKRFIRESEARSEKMKKFLEELNTEELYDPSSNTSGNPSKGSKV